MTAVVYQIRDYQSLTGSTVPVGLITETTGEVSIGWPYTASADYEWKA